MTSAAVPPSPAGRPGYDPSAEATARRVLPMLSGERVAWLSTASPDGRPHLVPTWFLWDGEALLVWSKPNAAKVRNLRANPRLMVAVGDASADFSVGLVEAHAECVDATVPDAFFAKYAGELAAGRLDPDAFRATYTQALRIVPARFLAWHGRGERHDPSPAPAAPATRLGRGPARTVAGLAFLVAALFDRASRRLRAVAPSPAPVAG